MGEKRTAVIEDMQAFEAYLASMPLIRAIHEKAFHQDAPKAPKAKSGGAEVDKDLLEALKSMA